MLGIVLRILLYGLLPALIAASVVAYNAFVVPKVLHLANYTEGVTDLSGIRVRLSYAVITVKQETPLWKNYDLEKYVMFRPLSKLIFRHFGNYCDFPVTSVFMTPPGVLSNGGKNSTISTLIYFASQYKMFYASPKDQKEKMRLIEAELENALNQCDPNEIGENFELPPLFLAMAYREEKAFSMLLGKNVDMKAQMVKIRNGKFEMTPIEFARFFEKNDMRRKEEYFGTKEWIEKWQHDMDSTKNMIVLLEKHAGAKQ